MECTTIKKVEVTFRGKYFSLSRGKFHGIVNEFRDFFGKSKNQDSLFLFGLIVHFNDQNVYYEYNHSCSSLMLL